MSDRQQVSIYPGEEEVLGAVVRAQVGRIFEGPRGVRPLCRSWSGAGGRLAPLANRARDGHGGHDRLARLLLLPGLGLGHQLACEHRWQAL